MEENARILLATQSEDLYSSKQNILFIYTKDPIVFLVVKIYVTNTGNLSQFVVSIQFDIEKSKMYTRVMQNPNATKWAKAMEKDLDQL